MTMRTLRTLHRWAGLILALPIILQALTGAWLALAPMLPERASVPVTTSPAQPLNDLLAAAANATHARPSRYMAPDQPGRPARIQFASGETVLVDPATARVVARETGSGVEGVLRSLHVNLMLPDHGGRSIAGWFGLGLLLLGLTGIPLWWPRPGQTGAAFTVPFKARGVRLQRRLHGAAGIYTLVMLLVLSGSGAALAFPATVRAWMGLPAGGPPRMSRSVDAAGPLPDLDRTLAMAQQAAPGARLRMMTVPATATEPVRLMLLQPGTEGAAGTVIVVADPARGRVLSVQDPAAGPAADRAWRWMHDLHEGAGLGPIWRILTVGGGLGTAILTVTGPFMWWLKRRQRKRPMPRALSAPVTE